MSWTRSLNPSDYNCFQLLHSCYVICFFATWECETSRCVFVLFLKKFQFIPFPLTTAFVLVTMSTEIVRSACVCYLLGSRMSRILHFDPNSQIWSKSCQAYVVIGRKTRHHQSSIKWCMIFINGCCSAYCDILHCFNVWQQMLLVLDIKCCQDDTSRSAVFRISGIQSTINESNYNICDNNVFRRVVTLKFK